MSKDIYWLNKDSITFLERGYLPKGQTAIERIHEISKAAEKILKKKGFAEKFESYMHKKLVRKDPMAHIKIFFKDMAHLLGMAKV